MDALDQRLALSRHAINRRSDLRESQELWSLLRSNPLTKVVLVSGSRFLSQNNQLHTLSLGEIDSLNLELFYLGESLTTGEDDEVVSFVAADVDSDRLHELSREDLSWLDIKTVGHQLSDLEAGLVTQAIALSQWHRSYRFTPETGEETEIIHGGWVRRGLQDDSVLNFPRTDPAVIVLVTDNQDRILLGNNAMWESNRYSLLAGFVEPGESLEAAVIREVYEESGLVVENPRYLASQPWPFPRSLMLGFQASLSAGHSPEAHQADGQEIIHLRWFTREELMSSLDEIVLPGKTAIARVMIEHWLGHPLEYETTWGN